MGEKISLGSFTHEFNWLEANVTSYPVSSGILYHEQYFEMGSICELNLKPRRSVAKVFIKLSIIIFINLIQFNNFKIFCDETATNQLDTIDLISEIESCVYEIHIKSHSICKIPYFSKKPNSFNINCNPVAEPDVFDKYSQKKNELEKKVVEKPVKMDFTMSSLVDDLAKSFLNLEGTISDIDDSDLKDLNEDFDEDKNEANLLSKLKEIKTETKDKFDKLIVKDEVIDTLSRKLTNLIDELSTSNDLLNNKKPDSQIEEDIVSGNDLTDNKLSEKNAINELLEDIDQYDDKLSNLEKTLSEQLAKKQELVDKFKTNKFKVKIVRFDPTNPHTLREIGDSDSNDINELMSKLFEDEIQSKKLKRLKENYEFVLDADNVSEESSDSKDKEKWLQNETHDENEENPEKLIIF